ncbi:MULTISPECIES: ABC transporter ATP-binding protein [unclassified Sedimentibacter]|uniref:ABC transporter ATP-binding protein n=1 Tax=unclassified Sedimentibacter TaxID=2649220 RepID=UPI0027E07CA5|nr:ABC transporter ATP-binding protein [Sedimentibacter sp. MB35-C1]WMJ77948.1 ABC transporter ATP-binding protein [Sedimentibacter sp. MB35-C1]
MLKIDNLSKKFGDFQVLSNININAEKSQIYGLVGSNGCGKTTLLKHIMMIYRQDKGNIFYDDVQVKEDSEILKDFYYVQDSLFFPYQSTLGKLFEYEKLMYDRMSEEKFNELVSYFNIDKNKSLNKMSKGQKKQAAFVLAISSKPRLLLLDEIVDGLDAVIKRKFWDILIREVIDNEMTVVISSHDLKELDNICDKVGIMHEGKILREENLEKMKDEIKRVQFAVDGEFDAAEFAEYNIIRSVKIGSINICTLTGDVDEFEKKLESKFNVLLFDKLSMSLEEIFITELGGAGYGTEKK